MVDGKAGRHLIIRADANTRIGTGHLMRCLALAQAWKNSGGEVAFITACESAGLLQRLSDEGFEAIQLDSPYPDPADWEVTSQVLATHPNAWMVLDGYHFDSICQIRIKEAGHPLLVIDDMAHLEHYYANIVLNQNSHAEQLNYSCEPHTELLLGAQYVLLRREFLQWQDWKREIPKVARKVMVTLGGSDTNNVTLKVIQALQQVDVEGLEAVVVVGSSNSHFEELQTAVSDLKSPIWLERNVTNMPKLMAWADVAISAGGSTCWEMAFMGLPTVLLVLADNQRDIGEGLSEAGVVHNLGWFEQVTDAKIADALLRLLANPDGRSMMSNSGRELVDGLGRERVIEISRKQKKLVERR